MSVEKLELDEFISFCAHEAELRKWFAGAQAFAQGLKDMRKEQEKAERARDKAYADRDAAVREIAAKQAKYEGDMKAALADVARVTKEKTDALAQEKAEAGEELAALFASIARAREAKALAEGQRDAFREEADRESVAITAALTVQRAALAESKGLLAAALKS